jgi:hypothetical protein
MFRAKVGKCNAKNLWIFESESMKKVIIVAEMCFDKKSFNFSVIFVFCKNNIEFDSPEHLNLK